MCDKTVCGQSTKYGIHFHLSARGHQTNLAETETDKRKGAG